MKALDVRDFPKVANAGLNFYSSVFNFIGPSHITILLILSYSSDYVITAFSILLLVTTFTAPFLNNYFLRDSKWSMVLGFFARSCGSSCMGGIMIYAYFAENISHSIIFLYAAAFLANSYMHKIYFNVGWLYVMRVLSPEEGRDVFVARVRRVNALVSMAMSIGLIAAVSGLGADVLLLYCGVFGIFYSVMSFVVVTLIMSDPVASTKIVALLPGKDQRRLGIGELVRMVSDRQTIMWLMPAILPSFIVPPMMFLYFVKIVGTDATKSLILMMSIEIATSSLIPRLVPLFRDIGAYARFRISLFASLGVLVVLLMARHTSTHEFLPYVILASILVTCSFIAQCLNIIVHNDVIQIGGHKGDNAKSFILYNLALDVAPVIFLVIAGLLIPISKVNFPVNPYEILFICMVAFAHMALLWLKKGEKIA